MVSVILVVVITLRMEVADHEGHPIHLGPRWIGYWLWLLKEIIVSNIDVARRLVARDMPIQPHTVRIKVSQKTDLGKTIYANSITLTPGTVSMSVEGDEILVHALADDFSEGLKEGTMDRKVTKLEGS
uniref:Multisubunit Na+/H+ antiporter, MnhE subunit n=1 Tax=Magnetococcus massalia (strain MO-1) TaxID=451514 RepID=A0A1S7LHG2_MAGMO